MLRTLTILAVLSFVFVGCNASDPQKPEQKAISLAPPTLIPFKYESGEVAKSCKGAIDKANTQIEELLVLSKGARTFDRTIGKLDTILGDINDTVQKLIFMGYVSTNSDIRAEGSECEADFAKFMNSLYSNDRLYDLVKYTFPSDPTQALIRKDLLTEFKKSGSELTAEKRKELVELKDRLSELEAKFNENLNNDLSTVAFTAAELEGLPEDYIQSLPASSDGTKRLVAVKSAHNSRVMENAKNPETRKRMALAWLNRATPHATYDSAEKPHGIDNNKVLEEAVLLREKIASLLGYKTWADYRTDGKLAANSETVLDFLSALKAKLKPKKDEDFKILLEAKRKDDPKATQIDYWDIVYYENQVKKDKYNIDGEKIREYFPADLVMKKLFEVYSKILGVSFQEVAEASVWHDTVKMYSVRDKHSGRILAHFFTDLTPRAGKYGHAAAFPIILGRILPNGSYQKPVAAIVANFNPATADKPALWSHDEVETLFHEFGHIMHQVLTKSRYAITSGSATKQDFVEAPSQMLENWVWNKDILRMISGHYLNPEEKIPEATVDQMIALKNFNAGYTYLRQVTLSTMDMNLHTAQGPVDTTKLHDKVYADIMGVTPPAGNHMLATFGHMMGGYDAGYYGYLWSKVYAEDMFTAFQSSGVLNENTGMSYRVNILEPGGTESPVDMLRRFLDRDPNKDAFYKSLGLGSP